MNQKDPSASAGSEHYIEEARRSLKARAEAMRRARRLRFDTIAVHGLYTVDEALDHNHGAIMEPTVLSSAQAYRDSDEMELALGYKIPTWCYTRIHNPTLGFLEDKLALLETYGSDIKAGCCVYSSGMAAIGNTVDALLALPGTKPPNFVSACQLYGGSYQLFDARMKRERGVDVRMVIDTSNIDEWRRNIDKNTRFLYGEMPSNPGLAFFDVAAVAALAHEHGIPFVIDSTIASPALLRPILHGADVVIHSATKVMSCSGLGMAGAVIARMPITSNIPNDELKADFALYLKRYPQREQGGCLHPFQATMTLADLRTLRARVDNWSQTAMAVARFLEKHPGVLAVNYLGLESYPLHEVAKKYLWLVDAEHDQNYGKPVNRYTHMMSFRVKGGAEGTRKAFDRLNLIWRATDLGRVKTVATIPAISTHLLQGEEAREKADVPADLVRLSVGAEHPDDIVADLEQALSAAK
ncbi:O-acetylhomoserine aminocarboxypropyltransferase/cysteine synthase [candidate division WOR-3 bacterium]|nr:O-acetylhomoserine aminocarboxypropyltransferase/cysteine synthase [candidate division WOR-3 bacterium]